MGRIQLTQQVGHHRPQVGASPNIRQQGSVVVPYRIPVSSVEIDIVIILLQHSPYLVEHLPELVVQDNLHVFGHCGLGGAGGVRVYLVDGAAAKAVQRILAAEEGSRSQFLDLLRLGLRVRNLKTIYTGGRRE